VDEKTLRTLRNNIEAAFSIINDLISKGNLTESQKSQIFRETWPVRLVLRTSGASFDEQQTSIKNLGKDLQFSEADKFILVAGIQAWARLINVNKTAALYYLDRFNAIFSGSSSPAISSSPNEVRPGGIDFRALPMAIQPMGSFTGLNFKLPQLTKAELAQINIDSEMQQIRNMVSSGIIPSGERIKELVAACIQKKEINSQADSLLLCLADTFKLEEENASESSTELREALVIVDSLG